MNPGKNTEEADVVLAIESRSTFIIEKCAEVLANQVEGIRATLRVQDHERKCGRRVDPLQRERAEAALRIKRGHIRRLRVAADEIRAAVRAKDRGDLEKAFYSVASQHLPAALFRSILIAARAQVRREKASAG